MRRCASRGRRIENGRVCYALRDYELDEAIERVTMWWPGTHPANADVYAPRDDQRVPKTGAWAMITRQLPPIEGRLNECARIGRVFYVEHMTNADDDGFVSDGTYKVKCTTQIGDVILWPYEYTVMRPAFLTDAWARGEYVFHPLRMSEHQLSDVLFYCLSRGISRADAVVMSLGTMVGPIGWFEPAPAVAADVEAFLGAFRNVGILTNVNHERRRKARARMQKHEGAQ